METRESNGKTDYIYYPIEYATKVVSTVLTTTIFPGTEFTTWIVPIDKKCFLNGLGANYVPYSGNPAYVFNVISVGF